MLISQALPKSRRGAQADGLFSADEGGRSDKGEGSGMGDCQKVAALLWHRAGEELRNECDEATVTGYVQGHVVRGHLDGADGDKAQRISYVPLPAIYGKHADGMIRRAMIVEPAGKSGEISELIRTKLTGAILTANGTFTQYLPNKAFRVWRSVTPVVLHGYNTSSRGVISVAKTERLLLRAFEMAGFREEQIENLAFQSGPFWQGTKHAAAMRVPAHLRGIRGFMSRFALPGECAGRFWPESGTMGWTCLPRR
jgi:CRISPR-associated protein Csb2